MHSTFTSLLCFFLLGIMNLTAQQGDAVQTALNHLQTQKEELRLTDTDIAGLVITDHYASRGSGIQHIFFRQTYQGIRLTQATANANVTKEGKLINMNIRLVDHLESKITNQSITISAQDAVRLLTQEAELPFPTLEVLENKAGPEKFVRYKKGKFATEPVQAKLVFQSTGEDEIRLCWEVSFFEHSGNNHWIMRIDCQNGKILHKENAVLHCDFGHPDDEHEEEHSHNTSASHKHDHKVDHKDLAPKPKAKSTVKSNASTNLVIGGSYRVFPTPIESPIHGASSIVSSPEDLMSSPFGWHDVDGLPGNDYLITRGNNVHAYQDAEDDDSSVGDEPNGGESLTFDFPLAPNSVPSSYREAAVTNLFYWCNLMHDVWYRYGFVEEAGNFQENNFDNGGEDGDYIRAEAQDGRATNNAYFSSQADGSVARIEMLLWVDGSNANQLFTVNSPANIQGGYGAVEGTFGAELSSTVPLTGDLVLVNDGSGIPEQACNPLINASEVNQNIAVLNRGNCNFTTKVKNAQDAGAIAAIICNDEAGAIFPPAGADNTIVIPCVMVSQADCDLIKVEIENGVNISLLAGGENPSDKDADFDNGIICHEYGHGISGRMTGGPSDPSCLNNAEQMGEGWSDWFGLMMTIEDGDTGADVRGIGNFATSQSIDGSGIRPAPYSSSFAVNNYTYGNSNDANISQPHGIGFIWATAIWDMTWALIDQDGYNDDLYAGTGGNNIAMHLVMEGIRLQPCNPGMIDGRDAILLADEQLYDGANHCLIWEAFARRGFGASASQGSSFNRSDQIEAFDLPLSCQTAVTAPSANFAADFMENCNGEFTFTDESVDVPQAWAWNFGDNMTSDEQNPTHKYEASGTYTVTLEVSNSFGSNSTSMEVVVNYPDEPVVAAIDLCEGQTGELTATSSGQVNWYLDDELVFSGSTYTTAPLDETKTYEVETEILGLAGEGGPADNSIGAGGYHNTGFTGTVIFEAFIPFTIVTADIDAGDTGERTIQLFDGSGSIIDEVTIFAEQGPSTATLNLQVPGPGMYAVGGTGINLFRNTNGANYPYEIAGFATITGSSATTAPQDYYYYLYNWTVREKSCYSPKVEVTANVIDGPTANFNFIQEDQNFDFSDISTNATSWSWGFGDGKFSNQENPSHTYEALGTYTVVLEVSDGTCTDIFERVVEITVLGLEQIEALEALDLTPNIGNGNIHLYVKTDQVLEISVDVFNTIGQDVLSLPVRRTNIVEEDFSLENLAAGTYIIRINIGEESVYRKYVLLD